MKSWMTIVAAGLVGLIGLGGCSTTSAHFASRGQRPATIASPPARLAAIPEAEQAVMAFPDSAERRVALGRLYLAAGRFASAESAFADALTLDPSLGGAMVNRALAQLAQNHEAPARITLRQALGKAPDADMGLGLAIAGEQTEAIALLEDAVRRSGGDVHLRQNLALVYGLAGRWADAAAMAARDVPGDQLGDRLRRWALIAQRPGVAGRLCAILGIVPAIDPGQPTTLALAAPRAGQALQPATAVAAVPAAPMAMASADLPPARAIAPPPRARSSALPKGHFVVQIGAYRSPGRLETIWTRLNARAAYLSPYTPAASRLDDHADGAVLHRLAIGGFDTRAAAGRICSRIRADGGHCFVRATAGDRPMTWASAAPGDRRS